MKRGNFIGYEVDVSGGNYTGFTNPGIININDTALYPNPIGLTKSVSYLESRTWDVTAASNTQTAVSFGTADADRYIILAMGGFLNDSAYDVTSVTIGGISATQIGTEASADPGGQEYYCIWGAAVPTGTSGSVVVNLGSSQVFQWSFSAYRCILNSLTPDSGQSNSNNSAATTTCTGTAAASGSIIIWSGGNANESQGTFSTTTNCTMVEDNEVDVRTGEWCSQGSGTSDGSGSCVIAHNQSEGGVIAIWD